MNDQHAPAIPPPPHRRWMLLLFGLLYLPFGYYYGMQLVATTHVDLPSFYYGAQVAFVDHDSPYRWELFKAIWDRIGQKVYPYLYPPPSLLFFYPFTWMGYDTAKVVMLAVNHLCLLWLAYWLCVRWLHIDTITRWRILGVPFALIVYLFLFRPSSNSIENGQVNLLTLAFICMAWQAFKQERHPLWGALPLAAAIVLKTYPALLLLSLLLRRQYRALAWVVGVLALLCAVSTVVLPPTLWRDYLLQTVPSGGYARFPEGLFSPAAPRNQSINGFTARLFLDNSYHPPLIAANTLAAVLAPTLLAVGILALVSRYILRGRGKPYAATVDDEWCVLLSTMFLIAPISWEAHLVFVLPPLLLVLVRAFTQPVSRGYTITVVAIALVLAIWVRSYVPMLQHGLLVLALSAKLYAVAALWWLTVRGEAATEAVPTGGATARSVEGSMQQ